MKILTPSGWKVLDESGSKYQHISTVAAKSKKDGYFVTDKHGVSKDHPSTRHETMDDAYNAWRDDSDELNQIHHITGNKHEKIYTFKSYDRRGFNESSLLNAKTRTPEQIAKKHGLPVATILRSIKIGAKTEHEHTKNQKAAEEIARDHLWERPDYYSRLKEVEGD